MSSSAFQSYDAVMAPLLSSHSALYIVVGSDNTDLVAYLGQQHRKTQFVILEQEPNLAALRQMELPANVHIASAEFDFQSLTQSHPQAVRQQAIQLIPSPGLIQQDDAEMRAFWQHQKDKYQSFINQLLNHSQLKEFVNNRLMNLPNNLYSLAEWREKQPGLVDFPALILGGGPSLDEAIEWVKQHQNKVVIFAAARIALRLQKEGITPDFFVTVDPFDVSYDNSKHIFPFADQSVLIHTTYANPPLISEWAGWHLYTESQTPWDESLSIANLHAEGPTVTNAMASIVNYLGFKQAYFLGVDLCYAASGATHESNSLEQTVVGNHAHNVDQYVETYSGRKAGTDNIFSDARLQLGNYLSQLSKELPQESTQFFSLSLESAKIDQVDYCAADQMVLPESDKPNLRQDSVLQTWLQPDPRERLNALSQHLKKLRSNLKQLNDTALDGLKTANRLYQKASETDKLSAKLQKLLSGKLQKKWANEIRYLTLFATGTAQASALALDNLSGDQDTIKTNLVNYFDALTTLSKELLTICETSLTHFDMRAAEQKGEKSLEKLVAYWLQTEQPGRAKVWQQQQSIDLNNLSNPHQELMRFIESVHQNKLADQESSLVKSLQDALTPEALLEKAVQAFENQQLNEVNSLASQLESLDLAPDDKADFKQLLTGLSLELQQQPEQAVERYIGIQHPLYLDIGLQRVVEIAMQFENWETAVNAAEVLTHLNPVHFLTYANVKEKMGRQEEANAIRAEYEKMSALHESEAKEK